jgi:hypothetical protein
MYRHVLVAIATLFAVSPLSAQAPSAVEQDLVKLENDWSTAWQKKDAAFLQQLFADEYLSTDQDGATLGFSDEERAGSLRLELPL